MAALERRPADGGDGRHGPSRALLAPAAGVQTMRPLIAVIDYGMGNLRSVQKALEHAGADARVTDSPEVVRKAQGVVLPGVGAFGEAVRRLKAKRLWNALREIVSSDKPFLGICLGYQLLFE